MQRESQEIGIRQQMRYRLHCNIHSGPIKDLIFLMDDPEDDRYCTPSKMGNLPLNRFIIDANANFEVLGIHYLSNSQVTTMTE